jgi:uncharacterized repeat protein (TIGR01451 family)
MPGPEIRVRRDSKLFAEMCAALADRGHQIRFQASGESMAPNIASGDEIVIAPVPVDGLRRGDVALIENREGFKVHRVASTDGTGAVITRSDNSKELDATSLRFVGKVISRGKANSPIAFSPTETRVVQPMRTLLRRTGQAAAARLRRASSFFFGLVTIFALSGICAATAAAQSMTITNTSATSYIAPGGTLMFTQVITNSSGRNDNAPTVTQNIPANTTFAAIAVTGTGTWNCTNTATVVTCVETGTYANKATSTLTAYFTVGSGVALGTTITDTVSVSGGNFTTVSATATSTVASADVTMSQVASVTTVAAGGTYTYTETATNNGPSTVPAGTLVVYQQTPPNTTYASITSTGWTCGTLPGAGNAGPIACTYNSALASGSTTTSLVITLTVNTGTSAPAAGTTIVNSATATSQMPDPIPSNNTSVTSILVEPANTSDLAVSVTVSPTPVFISSNLVYNVTIQNLGPSSAAATTGLLTFTLPASVTFVSATPPTGWPACTNSATTVTCNSNALAANNSALFAITVTAPGTATTLTGTATSNYTSDSNSNNNTASAVTVVQPILCATPGRDGAGTSLTGTLNTYFTPASGTLAAGSVQVTLGASSGATTPIASGDLLLFIQMQDAAINSSNTSSYGDGKAGDPANGSTNVASSGMFEFVTATSAVSTAGGTLTFQGTGPTGGLLNTYQQAAATATAGQQRYQVIRVPQYNSATLNSNITDLAWNGTVGGVLALDVAGQLTLGGTVAVDATGFRGAGGRSLGGTGTGTNTDYVNLSTNPANGGKAEGIAGTPMYVSPGTFTTTTTATSTGAEGLPAGSYARGAPGNAGGGGTDGDPSGNTENSGGGGGGNGGTGGLGGYGWNTYGSLNSTDGGFGGAPFQANTSALVMGGGGGAGTSNDGSYYISAASNGADCGANCTGIYSSGGAGGGIVIIHAGSVSGTGSITANGQSTTSTDNDSTGGGGAGGSIQIFANSGTLTGLSASANGGSAGNTWPTQGPGGFPGNRHGPGGGGAGGVIILTGTATTSVAAGNNGYTNTEQDSYGATPGTAGTVSTANILTEVPGTQSGGYCGGADLAVTNVATPTPDVLAGGTITYAQSVTNNGPVDAVNATFAEAIPANTTFSSIITPAGWTCTTPAVGATGNISCTSAIVAATTVSNFTVAVKVNAATTVGTQIVDVDTISSGTADPVPANNTATAVTTVGTATGADIVTTNTSSSPTTAIGGTFTVTAVATNQGPQAATSAGFTEAIPAGAAFSSFVAPAGWTCFTPAVGATTGNVACTRASFASGTSATFALTLTVSSGDTVGSTISALADTESATPDPNPTNNSATATTVVAANANQSDLAVTSVATPNPVSPGNNITYTQVVTNNGPAVVTNGTTTSVTFTDTIPANTTLAKAFVAPAGWTCNTIPVGPLGVGTFTCTLNAGQTLAVGATVNFPMVVAVSLTATSGTTISNTANINMPCSATQDPLCANNTATSSVLVALPTQADVSITKSASPEPVNQGTNLTYTLQVTNAGPAIAKGVTVTDVIPAQVTYVSSSSSIGATLCTYTAATTTLSCPIGTMSVGSVVVITINATASTFSSASLSTNTATVTATTSDPNLSNNTASATSTIQASTAVDLAAFHAYVQADGSTSLEWNTHEESRNLGFNIYREDGSGRHRVNPSLVAGSGLLLRGSKPQHAAKAYRWIDPQGGASFYWIEDLDVNGTRTLHGPYYPEQAASSSQQQNISNIAARRSPLLNQLRATPAVIAVPSASTSSNSYSEAQQRPRVAPPVVIPVPPTSRLVRPQFNLADGEAVKIGVQEEGWYHVTFQQLYAAGLDVNADPRALHLYAEGVDQPLLITNHPNGPVQPSDAIEFYGTPIDTPFSGTRIYWLVRQDTTPKRISSGIGELNGAPSPASFPFTVTRQDRTTYFAALLNGENNDNFFGDVITSTPVDEDLLLTHIDSTATSIPVQLTLTLQGGVDQQEHSVSVQVNGSTIGDMVFQNLVLASQTFPVDASLIHDGTNTVTLTALNGDNDISLVQSVNLQYAHTYAADSDWLRATVQSGELVTITGFGNPQIRAFDTTDPLNINEIHGEISAASGAYQIAFTAPGNAQTRTIVALAADAISSPVSLAHYTPSYLDRQRAGADYVVIAHPDFVANLTPLLRLREAQGHKVLLATTDELYDLYNFGEKSPFAIQTFLQSAMNAWQTKPQAILLAGDASFDPRNYLGLGDLDFVPTRLIETAAFKTASDDWFSDFQQNGYATIATGRLPFDTTAEADLVVSKIVGYESGNSAGTWSNQALVVADQNVDANFTSAASSIVSSVPSSLQVNQILANNMEFSSARAQLLASLNNGALLVNYSGHGAEQQWSFGDLFDENDAAAMSNGGRLPFFMIMDCLNGYFQDVYTQSLAESLLFAPNGGAVAVWASSGLTNQPPQATMNMAAMAQLSSAPNLPIGQLLLAAKSGITDNDVRRTWLLFGDPAMKLQIPRSAGGSNQRAPFPRPNPIKVNGPRSYAQSCGAGPECPKERRQQ